MQTATKRGSPPRARRGASPHFFGGSPAGAPARQAGGFGVWGRAGPAPPAPGPSRQVPHGGKRVRGAARGKKAGRCGTGEKGARCGAGEKAGRCGTGKKAGRCGTGSGRPFVSREKVPKGPAGPAPSPSRQQGRAGKKGKGGFPFFPALGVPGAFAGDADGAGAAGPRDVRRGQSRRCGVSPKRDAPKGHRAAAHVFGTFCGALPTHKSIGRVRTRRRCRRRDFAGRPPRCRPRGRWSGGCRQRGARPPR